MKHHLPEIVYKYRNWTNEFNKAVLLKNEVYLSPPKDFNDPFDCRVTKNHHLLDTPEKIEKYIEKGIEDNLDFLVAEGRDIGIEKEQLRERLKDLDVYQREHEKINDEYTDKYLGVLSLSSRWNSILMWSHYGDYHKGYCIGFNEKCLRMTGAFGKGGNVIYTDDLPKINPIEDQSIVETSFYQTHYKAKDWEYEQEYRLTKLFFDNPEEIPIRVVKLPEDCIREVVLGIKISDDHKAEIIGECSKRDIPVYQALKEPYEFKIRREKIS